MAYLNFSDALMEAKRRAQLQGRPLSQQEVAGISEGWAQSAGDINLRNRALTTQEKQFAENLAFQKQQAEDQKRIAEKAGKRESIQTGISTVGQGAMIYGVGKQAGWWGSQAAAPAAKTATGVGTSEVGAGAGAGGSSGGSSGIGSAALPAAIVVGAEMAKGQWGGLDKGWDEASRLEQFTLAPAAFAMGEAAAPGYHEVAKLVPGDLGKGIRNVDRELARLEQQGLGPIDKLLGLTNPQSGFMYDSCIIVSSCTSPNSYKVKIVRAYRMRFMSDQDYFGYQVICGVVVPFIKKYKFVKYIFNHCGVDPFIDYAKWKLGRKRKCNVISMVISKSFLGLCQIIGEGVNAFMEVQRA